MSFMSSVICCIQPIMPSAVILSDIILNVVVPLWSSSISKGSLQYALSICGIGKGQYKLAIIETVLYETKTKFEILILKSISFYPFKSLTKSCTKLGYFSWTLVNKIKPKWQNSDMAVKACLHVISYQLK